MLKTMGIIQACFPAGRCACRLDRRFGGQRLLQWVVRRVTDSMRLDGVMVLACDAAEHQYVRDLVPPDVPVFLAREGSDPLGRFLRALEEFPAESVVRVRGDNPFVDPVLIDRLVTTAEANPACDYVSYCSHDGRPAILSPVGIYAEWFRAPALRLAARGKVGRAERESVTGAIYARPEKFNLRFIPVPEQLDRDDVRLTLLLEEDWDNALTIFDALGPDRLDWQRIASLLDGQPALRQRMAALNRVHGPQ